MEEKDLEIKHLQQQLEELKKENNSLKSKENPSFLLKREALSITDYTNLAQQQHPIRNYPFQLNNETTVHYKMHSYDNVVRMENGQVVEGNLIGTEIFVPAIFKITDELVDGFQSGLDGRITRMDCVISAFQLLGVFDAYTANILRMTHVGGSSGYNRKQIEMTVMLWDIFMTKNCETGETETSKCLGSHEILAEVRDNLGNILPHIIDYVKIGSFNMWANYVGKIFANNLHKKFVNSYGEVDGNPALFCGYSVPGAGPGHVFVILKNLNNDIILLDPQSKKPMCNFGQNLEECTALLREEETEERTYYILYHSVNRINNSKQLEYFGFKLDQTVRQTSFNQMIKIIDLDHQDEFIGTSACNNNNCADAANALLSLKSNNEKKTVSDADIDELTKSYEQLDTAKRRKLRKERGEETNSDDDTSDSDESQTEDDEDDDATL